MARTDCCFCSIYLLLFFIIIFLPFDPQFDQVNVHKKVNFIGSSIQSRQKFYLLFEVAKNKNLKNESVAR